MEPSFGTILIGFIVLVVAIVVLQQIQIRRQYRFESGLRPDQALQAAARAVGGGTSFIDAGGQLSIPHRDGVISVGADPSANGGSMVHVWLSEYAFFRANGFQVMQYQGRVRKIRRAVGA